MGISDLIAKATGADELNQLIELEKALPFAGPQTFMRAEATKHVKRGDIVAMGVPFDAGTTFRPGTRFGPRAIREQSNYAGAFQPVYPWDTEVGHKHRLIDFGDVVPFPGTGAMEMMLGLVEGVADHVNGTGARLLTLGGDHTLPIPLVRSLAKRRGPVALVHLDAHQDSYPRDIFGTGEEAYNHGVFATVLVEEGHVDPSRSTQAYIRTIQPESPKGGYDIVYGNDAMGMSPESLAARIRERAGDGPVYLTLDIDALDPSSAPGTGSPVPGGPSTGEVRRLLKALDGIDLVGADIVEVNPLFDPTGITAVAAAHLAIDLVQLMDRARW